MGVAANNTQGKILCYMRGTSSEFVHSSYPDQIRDLSSHDGDRNEHLRKQNGY